MAKVLKVWPLNAARILDCMYNMIIEAGGYIVERWPFTSALKPFEVVNEFEPGRPTIRLRVCRYLSFVINDRDTNSVFIDVNFSDNPFFDHYYTKEITDGVKVSQPQTAEILKIDWYKGASEYEYLSDEQVKESAKGLLEWLMYAPITTRRSSDSRNIEIRKVVSDGR